MESAVITTRKLTKRFGDNTAVGDLSLEVPRGVAFGFLGPNGSGKTTTIRLLLGLIRATSGSSSVFGYDSQQGSRLIREKCGVLSERPGVYQNLTGEQNLDYFGRIWQIRRAERRVRIREVLQRVELWDRRKERVETWSKGMKQKLAIARSLLNRPELVFLDEPTLGLDPQSAVELREMLALLVRDEGVTVFLTSHNLPEVEKLCTMVGVMNRGSLLACGEPAQLAQSAGNSQVEILGDGFPEQEIVRYIQSSGQIRLDSLSKSRILITTSGPMGHSNFLAFLGGRGATISEVKKVRVSLEDIYVDLMEKQS